MYAIRRSKRLLWKLSATAVVVSGLACVPGPAAHADVLPENAGDVGVYTDGASDPLAIGDPMYSNQGTVAADLEPGVDATAESMHRAVFEKDLAAGGTDYYLDRILGVRGTLGSPILMTRGRSLYMRGIDDSSFTQMGFAGTAYAGGPITLGDFYTIEIEGQDVTEQSAQRFNAPSHASTRYTIGSTGVVADQTKLITYDNVALTSTTFDNPGSAAVTLTVRAASGNATDPGEEPDELVGTHVLMSGANNGLVDTPWDTADIKLQADGFTRDGTELTREITVPGGGSASFSVVGVLGSETLPDSETSYREYADLAPAEAVRTGITDFNRRYADEVPYINVPDAGVEKAIVYRWWGERYNSLDVNAPGYVYQYPTTIEGVNLYQNAVALTQPMHLQDTKWLRTPYLPYGQILNIGELSGDSAFLDSPGHTSWNNHYSQYLGTAGLEAYNVHGGGAAVAERFARYFEGDAVGQLEHYDGDGDNLIAYDSNNMPGNDADAISFGYPKADANQPGSATIERPESAYVWGAFDAARQLYGLAGAEPAKVTEMATQADAVRDAVLSELWSPSMEMFLSKTSYGATAARSSNGAANPLPTSEAEHIPAKESNMYDVYAENLIPAADAATYVDGFRFMTYGDNFPIFPFYTANQYDRTKFGIGGSNNFSNINFTVQYRALRAALRTYDPTEKYVDPEYARKLLDWVAWSVYPDGDMRVANQAEYYSGWNASTKTYQRNNPYHVMLGNMNYAYVEDMGGIQPRSDEKIELAPIDLGYDHFMVNNLRYHDRDITIVWDADGSHYDLGAGYSLFIDGDKVVTVDTLGGFVYDPVANTVVPDAGVTVTSQATAGRTFPTAVQTGVADERVVDYLKTAGIDLTEDATNLATGATLSPSATQSGTRPTPWAEFHTPGLRAGPNYTPGAITTTERPVALSAVTDGSTANEPYWGNYGTTGSRGYVQLDLGSAQTVDNVKVWFMSDRHEGGYQEPSRFFVEIPDGSGGWEPIEEQAKSSTRTLAKFNEVLFSPVSTDRLRVSFDNRPGSYTAISEIQAFNSGRDVPAAPNQAPVVTAKRSDAGNANLRATLTGTVLDDGAPYDQELSYEWSVVSTPSGATAELTDPTALTTALQGSVAGDYVARLTATDGALTTTADVDVTLAPRDAELDFGPTATITTSGTSPWENAERVNDDGVPTSSNPGGPGFGWGTYGQAQNGTSPATQATLQYTWDTPVRLTSTDLFWYDDDGGISVPSGNGWQLETSADGTTWTAVTLTGTSAYADAIAEDTFNELTFEPVVTRYLRVRIYGTARSAGGVGVLRWKASGPGVESARSPVIVRTTVGVAPTLPDEIDAVFTDGARGSLPVTWPEIAPEQYAAVNVDPFTVNGDNKDYGQLVPAQVYVRSETSDGGITIVGAEQFAQSVDVGEQPVLPTKVAVSYNDGSRDNQAIGVTWAYDPTVVDKAGVYTITGNLELPRYVGSSGVTTTRLVLTVGDGGGTNPPTNPPESSDTTGPTIAVTGVTNGATYPASDTLALSWQAADPSGVTSLTATLDGAAIAQGPLSLLDLARGTHQLAVTAVDGSGNRATSSVAFTTRATTVSVKMVVRSLAKADRLSSHQRTDLLQLIRKADKAVKNGKRKQAASFLKQAIRVAKTVRNAEVRSALVKEIKGARRSLR